MRSVQVFVLLLTHVAPVGMRRRVTRTVVAVTSTQRLPTTGRQWHCIQKVVHPPLHMQLSRDCVFDCVLRVVFACV